MTATEELALVDAAITTILGGTVQAYSINGRSVNRLDIRWLTERKSQLEQAISRESTGLFYAGQFRKPE
jgi:hypothetical protein